MSVRYEFSKTRDRDRPMGLTQALATSLSGLQATQADLSVVAGNVANAQTAGYVARSVNQIASAVRRRRQRRSRCRRSTACSITFVQQQLWTESAGGAYANLNANFYQQLQQVYGQPGSSTTLDSVFNDFTTAVQALSTSPNSFAAQNQTISCRSGFGAATQQRDGQHPDAARSGRPGHRQRCTAGQQRPAADRDHQSAAGGRQARSMTP